MTIVKFDEKARLIIGEAAAKFTHRYEGLSNRWVYKGGDYGDNNYMGVLGEIAAAIVLGRSTSRARLTGHTTSWPAGGEWTQRPRKDRPCRSARATSTSSLTVTFWR